MRKNPPENRGWRAVRPDEMWDTAPPERNLDDTVTRRGHGAAEGMERRQRSRTRAARAARGGGVAPPGAKLHASRAARQTTALVNEAFLRLTNARAVGWQDRAHFLGIAARLKCRVLVDYARARGYRKRGGGACRVTLDEGLVASPEPQLDVVALDRALEALAAADDRKSRVIELRFFGGLSVEETAEVLHVSTDTVKRDWRLAKLWLLRELEGEAP
jgi:RNA polymerase sigma factor (TIGR02999 family)